MRMLGHVQAMYLMGWRLCKLYDAGKMTPGHASLAKVNLGLTKLMNGHLFFINCIIEGFLHGLTREEWFDIRPGIRKLREKCAL